MEAAIKERLLDKLKNEADVALWWRTLEAKDRMLALRINQWGYRHRAADWIERFIDWGERDRPAHYQLAVARAFLRNPSRRMVVRSLHGSGKTAMAAWLVLWFVLTRDGFVDWKVVTTAGSWTQLTHYLWPEIHKWSRRLKWHLIGRPPFTKQELLTLSIKGETGEAFAVSTNDVALIEGAHATHLFYLFDEAKAIPEEIWDGAEGAFSNADASGFEGYALAISTPGAPSGRFYDLFTKRDKFREWWTYHITLNAAIEAGRVSKKWAEDRARNWGKDSALYQNRVLGNFAKLDETSVIPLSAVEKANERWEQEIKKSLKDRQLTAVGVDVAWQGGDKSVITPLYDHYFVPEQYELHGEDPMAVVGRVISLPNVTKQTPIVVDVIGIGAGVVSRLRELGYNVIPFNGAEKTNERDESGNFGFTNRRSASWWRLRELMLGEDAQLAIPIDDELTADLTTPKWRVASSGKIQVESKDDFRKRLGRSPDKGDSLTYALSYHIKRVGII